VINGDGSQFWFKNVELNSYLHRDFNKPAVIRSDGSQEWWFNGKLHRDDQDQPAIIKIDELQEWWLNGELHRDHNKPAVIRSGFCLWYINGVKQNEGELDADYIKG